MNKEKTSVIRDFSTVFLDRKLGNSFPGDRGIKWYNSEDAVKRLSIFFKPPLLFNTNVDPINFDFDHSPVADPIWWFRGHTGSFIENYETLSKTKILLNYFELEINRIAVNIDQNYHKSYIYVESYAEKQIGINTITENDIRNQTEFYGYAFEEYSLFRNQVIRSEEHSDGAAIINNEVVDLGVDVSERRKRFLSKYNFIVCAKQAPYNCKRFQKDSNDFFGDVLLDESNSNKLFEYLSNFKIDERLMERLNKI